MAIESICTGCGKTLSVADENAGKRARCPACGQIYTIPSRSNPSAGGGFSSADRLGGDSNYANDFSPASSSSSGGSYPDGYSGSDPTRRSADAGVPPEAVRYWMRAVDGSEYGPVDQTTLDRWFREGRVGPGYQLRQSQYGNWQPADIFRPAMPHRSDNPFAEAASPSNPFPQVDPTTNRPYYPKGDQGVLVLVMGILGFFCCPIFGIVAWILGHTALNAIQAGLADPSTKGLVQVGYYLGIASVVVGLLCYGGQILVALAGIAG